jgi:multicomponent K+:H+ antiporter subunit F
MTTLLQWAVTFAFICILMAMLFCIVRLLIGPTAHDRVLALDTLWICAMLLSLTMGITFSNLIYFEMAMLISLLGFVSTIALTKFLMRGEIIE